MLSLEKIMNTETDIVVNQLNVHAILNAADMMQAHVWSANIDQTLAEIEKIMIRRNLSSVPVIDSKGALYGIVNRRDLLRCRAAKTNLRAIQAWEICKAKPIEVVPDMLIHELARLMLEKGVAEAVVIDKENHVILGIVSSFDFVQRMLSMA